MKHQPSRALLLAVLSLLLAACAAFSPRTGPLAVSASSAGIAVTDAALKSYDDLEGLYVAGLRSTSAGDLLKYPVEGHPNYQNFTALGPVQQRQAAAWAESIETRRRAARNLREAYSSFNRLAGGEFGNDTQAAVAQLNTTISSFAAARGHPFPNGGPIPDIVGSAANLIIGGLQARRIKQHNRNLAELVRQFHALWEEDTKAWGVAIDAVTTTGLAPSLAGLSDDKLDQAAVVKLIPEPVSTPLKLRLYRMKVLNDAASSATAAKSRLTDVGNAFDAVEHAHEELAKDNPSITDVLNYVDHAVELSKSAEKDPADVEPK